MNDEFKLDTSAVNRIAPNAVDVSNAILSRTGQALMQGNFSELVQCFFLPSVQETFEGRIVLRTETDLRRVFDGVRKHLVRECVTDMIRHCVSAEFRDENTVHATHETRLMNGTCLVQEPYPCFSILRRIDRNWKITFASYAIVNSQWHIDALMGQELDQGMQVSV